MTDLTLTKLKRRVPEIIAAAQRAALPLAEVWHCPAAGPAHENSMAPPPPADDAGWQPLREGQMWGYQPGSDPHAPPRRLGWNIPADGGSNHWLRASISVPEAWRGGHVRLALEWEGRGAASIEAIVYLNGRALAGLDECHRSVQWPSHEVGPHEILIRCFVPYPVPFGGLRLLLRDESIWQLGQRMRAMLEALETMAPYEPQRHALLGQLNAAYTQLDLRDGWGSEAFAASAQAALQIADCRLQNTEKSAQDNLQSAIYNQPVITATGHAHLDVAWLWPLWRTRQKAAHTVATVLHLMERFPDYHFSMSQPQVYAYIKQDDPELYARLKARVAEGRFEPVGTMWVESDCNLPSGESLVRQLLHGALFWRQEFGRASHLIWKPDVFGYNAALPQLLRLCGIDCFLTSKLSWNQTNRMPHDTFRWRGIDGSEVLAHFITASDQPPGHPQDVTYYTYNGGMTAGEVAGSWRHYRQQALNHELLYLYGYGDGGGGPTEEMLTAAQLFGELPGLPQVQPGRVDAFFARLYERVWHNPRLPVWAGELYFEYHRGTYTSQSRTKQANRQAELLYREAEWLNAWATLHGAPNQQPRLNQGWQLILLNQFHDILPGSSIPQVYLDAETDYAEIRRIGEHVRNNALAYLIGEPRTKNQEPGAESPGLDGSGFSVLGSAAFSIPNSLPWPRREVARLPLAHGEAPPALRDGEGKALPQQLVEELDGSPALLVAVDVPGYSVNEFRVTSDELRVSGSGDVGDMGDVGVVGANPTTRQPDTSTSLENGLLRLELDASGEIVSLFDKAHGRELVAPGQTLNRLVLYEDRPLNWDAWDIDHFYVEKAYPLHETNGWQVVESGPLRSAIEITRQFGHSRLRQRICLWHQGRRVDFETEVDWQERNMLLRALFPLNLNCDKATCEIQFGALERPTHRNTSWDAARFEVCAQRWVDLSEGGYGLALLNNGKYGHSLHDGTLGLSLLKAANHPDPEADRG
nr:alpha-mannosidase [Chloroflexaceae bacterium]